MKEEYIRLFEKIKRTYPESYIEKIMNYLNYFEKTVRNNGLVQINIIACFKEACFKEGGEAMIEMFPEIYNIYEMTGFRMSELEENDIILICNSYVDKVKAIGGEFIDAVKKAA